MRLQTTIDIFDYWNRLRGLEDAPLKSQVEPGAVRHILPNLFILEKIGTARIGFRLAGTRICDLFGRDLRGQSFSSLWANGQHEDIEKTAQGVMDHAMPTLLNATGYSTIGHRASFEIIMMPLRAPEGGCDRLLGAIAPAVAASWLEIVPLELLALDRSRLLHDRFARPLTSEIDTRGAGHATLKSGGISEAMRRLVANFVNGTEPR
jgi:hypothetical protein